LQKNDKLVQYLFFLLLDMESQMSSERNNAEMAEEKAVGENKKTLLYSSVHSYFVAFRLDLHIFSLTSSMLPTLHFHRCAATMSCSL
jgi:hypothetical protein